MKPIYRIIITALACMSVAIPACSAASTRSFQPDGKATLTRPVTVLLAGDSLMEGLGPQLKTSLAGYEGLTLIPIGKRSTGLARPDYYNWPAVLEKNLQEHRPDVVVMWVGTNDPQNIYGQTGLGEPCSKAWRRAYALKMLEIINLARKYHARLVWMGPPVMDEEPLNTQLATINRDMKWVANKASCYFVDTRPVLADRSGRYQQSVTTSDGKVQEIRTRDHVHITHYGNILMMKALLPTLTRACEGPALKQRNVTTTPNRSGSSTTGSNRGSATAPRLRYP